MSDGQDVGEVLRRGVPLPAASAPDGWPAVRVGAARRRRRRRGLAAAGTSGLLGLAIALMALPGEDSSSSHRITVTDTRPPPAWPGQQVVDGEIRLPFVLLDGTRGTLVYPDGVLTDAQLSLGDSARCARDCGFSDVHAVRDATPWSGYPRLAPLDGVDGTEVEVIDLAVDRLVFRFGPWSVTVHTGAMGPGDREVWARSLDGEVTDDGWLIPHGSPPVTVGDGYWPSLDLHVPGLSLSVRRADCRAPDTAAVEPLGSENPTPQAAWSACLYGEVSATLSGDADLVEEIAGRVSVEDLTLPPG